MQSLLVTIPEPCHENWDTMSPTEKGRFCKACAKEVVDFTAMSDAQMLLYFSNLTTQNVCGRTYSDQLNRPMTAPEPIKKKSWYWNVFTFFLLFFSKSSAVKAQPKLAPNSTLKIPFNKPLMGRTGAVSVKYVSNSDVEEKNTSYVAFIVVKDDKTNQPISNATIIISNYEDNKIRNVKTSAKGNYRMEKMNADKTYYIKISAEGYNNNEFMISKEDWDRKKINREIYLTKKEVEETRVRLGGMHMQSVDAMPLYVIDGSIVKGYDKLMPEDIQDLIVLNKNEAIALFGTAGKNGAIVITTKQQLKEVYKAMDTVVVKGQYGVKKMTVGMVSTTLLCKFPGVTIKTNNPLSITEIPIEKPNTIKLYPNPVQRSNTVTVALKLKQTGNYIMRISNSAGTVLMQKQFHAASKELLQTIESDARWGSGIYYVWVLDETNKLTVSSSFIVL